MAAREDELEALVAEDRLVHAVLLRGGPGAREQLRLGGERPLAADAVDRPVARGADEPGVRVGRRFVARPALRGDDERLLGGLLGEVEVAEEADQRGQDPAPLVPEDALDQRSTTGRTSMAPPIRAVGMRDASSIAASRSSAS